MITDLILGPPGTGKTTKLLDIVADYMEQGVSPQRIAFVTFTRKGAHEARERALVKFPDVDRGTIPYFSTLHAIAFHRLNLQMREVLGRENWKEIATMCGMTFSGYYDMSEGQIPSGKEEGDEYYGHFGVAANRCQPWEEYFDMLPSDIRYDLSKRKFAVFVGALRAYKEDHGMLDYSDFLARAIELGPIDVDVAIIDEAQDLTQLQWRFTDALFPNVKHKIIAGDDDQTIYRWTGADLNHFLELPADNITVLERSWRLPRRIWEYAQKFTDRIENRYDKEWTWDKGREGEVNFVEDFRRVPIEDGGNWMVLVRNSYQMKAVLAELMNKGIPCSRKGFSMVKSEHMTAIRAWIKLQKGKEISLPEAHNLYDCMQSMQGVARGGKKKLLESEVTWFDHALLVRDYGLLVDLSVEWYDTLQKISDDQRGYYRRILRHGEDLTGEPRCLVSTIHGVKGGECDNVVILDRQAWRTVKEFHRNPDDEHRVFYVAATRAKEKLYIVRTNDKNHYPMPRIAV